MTITLNLPQELEDELAAEAKRLHLPLQEYVLRVLAFGRLPVAMARADIDGTGRAPSDTGVASPSVLEAIRAEMGDNVPRTGAEIVAYWEREGLIGTRTDITDSVEHARQLRRRAERRERP
jgi:hypothetical protein